MQFGFACAASLVNFALSLFVALILQFQSKVSYSEANIVCRKSTWLVSVTALSDSVKLMFSHLTCRCLTNLPCLVKVGHLVWNCNICETCCRQLQLFEKELIQHFSALSQLQRVRH